MNPEISSSIIQMLQGLAYLLAYYDCIDGDSVSEREFVVEAYNILRRDFGKKDYYVQMEYPYKKLPSIFRTKEEADIIIARREKDVSGKRKKEPDPEDVLCVLEFKMSTDTNGNVYKDAEKLRSISSSVDRLAVILFLKQNEPLRKVLVYQEINGKMRGPKEEKKKKDLKVDDKVNYKAKRGVIDLYKIELSKKKKSRKKSSEAEEDNKRYLTKRTNIIVRRALKAYSSTSNIHPYMAVCVEVLDSDYSSAKQIAE